MNIRASNHFRRCRRLLFITLCLFANTAQGQIELIPPQLKAPVRYDYQADSQTKATVKDRYQYQATLRSGLKLLEFAEDTSVSLKVTFGTGESYTSQWNTLHNVQTKTAGLQQFHVRQFFGVLQSPIGRLEFGVIPPVKGKVSHTSIDKDGWIRGARFLYNLPRDGALELVSGGIDRLDDPNAFQSWRRWNYHEFEWTQNWGDMLGTEWGGTQLGDDRYVRAEVSAVFVRTQNLRVDGRTELLRHLTKDVWASDTSLSLKVWRIKIEGEYSFVPSTFGQLGTLVNDFFTLGHLGVLRVSGRLGATHGLRWFGKTYWGEEKNRVVLGLGYAFQP